MTALTWDLSDLAADEADVDRFLDEARDCANALAEAHRGRVADLDGPGLVKLMQSLAEVHELLGRAQSYAYLRFAADTVDPVNGARLQRVQERATEVTTALLFFDIEWAALPDEQAAELLATPGLEFARHHLANARRYRRHLLTEPEEKVLAEKHVTGAAAWARLFGELTSALDVAIDGERVTFEEALSRLSSADRSVRKATADGITAALAPGLRTRAFVYNTLLNDKAVDDRLRHYDHWLASRNLANEASDESVQALVDAVRARFDLPQRWYRLKARLLGLDRLADYDRMAAVTDADPHVSWEEAKQLVLDSYASFSQDLADVAQQFFERRWIDVPARPGKQPGAFCMYTVPSVHPYVLLNFTNRPVDVVTLAHELGHGLHAYLARPQGVFHQGTPLTLAETASVFGETVAFGRLLDRCETPDARLSLLAQHIEGAIATVFRQTAMNRFEHLAHTARRTEGELSVPRLGELWAQSQAELFGDAVEITEGYRSWWSYIPHFVHTPGYVYAYAYGQLLALSVYRQYEEQGSDFVPRYLHLLASGGSMPPEELGRLVGCDLADPGFWDGGLAIVEQQLDAAETAAWEAGRLTA
ncbi:MAG: M3 family oligoendopeptidase [Actinomycetota bacterium]|nr:M3 family oligoendopeptidase [Actinomycetota bacterium]